MKIQNIKLFINKNSQYVTPPMFKGEREDKIIEARNSGQSYKEIADDNSITGTQARKIYLREKAKKAKEEGSLPKEYELKAEAMIKEFSFPKEQKPEIVELLINNPNLLPFDTKK